MSINNAEVHAISFWCLYHKYSSSRSKYVTRQSFAMPFGGIKQCSIGIMWTLQLIKSGISKWTFHEPQKPWQDDQFASQSRTQMVAHRNWTSSHQITEVNTCVELLGKTSHTIPPLSTQYWRVPGGTKTGKAVNGINCRNALNYSQRRWDCIRESSNTRGINCKVCWTHWDFRLWTCTFSLHFLFIFFLLFWCKHVYISNNRHRIRDYGASCICIKPWDNIQPESSTAQKSHYPPGNHHASHF